MTVVLRERLAQSFVTKRPLIAERARVLFGMLLRRANSIHLLPERFPLPFQVCPAYPATLSSSALVFYSYFLWSFGIDV